MKMKKFLAVCLSAAMTLSMLTACGGSAAAPAAPAADAAATEEAAGADDAAEAEAPAEEASGDVQEITFMIWDDLEASEDLITKGYKDSVDRFNKDFEGKYHCTPITTNLEEYYDKLNALVAAGDTPDVFIASPGANLNDYATTGVAAKLDD